MSLTEMFGPAPVAAPTPQQQAAPPPQHAPQPDVVDAEPVQGDGDPTQGRSIEDRARDMGWVDQAEFKGDPAKWRPADQFVNRAYDEPKIAAAMVAKLEQRLEDREQEFTRRIRGLERMHDMSLARQRDQILSNYDTAMRDAASVGDMEKFDRLQMAKADALKDHNLTVAEQRWQGAPQKRQPAANGNSTADNAVVSAWLEANSWATADHELGAMADTLSGVIRRQHPGLDAAQNLAEVKKRIVKMYPEKFGARQQAANGAASVEGGSRVPSGAGNTLYARLPREAQAEAMRAVKSGQFRSVEDWARVYNE